MIVTKGVNRPPSKLPSKESPYDDKMVEAEETKNAKGKGNLTGDREEP